MCAGGEDSLSSTPAVTQSPCHGRGPVGADSVTDNSRTEKSNSGTGVYTGTATVFPPSLSFLSLFPSLMFIFSLFQPHHHLMTDISEPLQTLQQNGLDLTMVSTEMTFVTAHSLHVCT